MAGLVSEAISAEAFAEDCARAVVVISPREASGDCKALLIDRKGWRAEGDIALRWTADRFAFSAARPPGYELPWARGLSGSMQSAPAARPAAQSATPSAGDLDADD
jgi:competence protein ComEC